MSKIINLSDLAKAMKSENDVMKGGPGSGRKIGQTNGKPIYDNADHPSHSKFTTEDHLKAAKKHGVMEQKADAANDMQTRNYHMAQRMRHQSKAHTMKQDADSTNRQKETLGF